MESDVSGGDVSAGFMLHGREPGRLGYYHRFRIRPLLP